MLLDCSSALITAVKKKQGDEISKKLNLLNTFTFDGAVLDLNTDQKKVVFWVNIYNAFFQLQAHKRAKDLAADWSGFFKIKQLNLFGLMLSFDDIEHVILRHSKWKFGLGYLNRLFPKKWERSLRVKKVDSRIHFLLNCGAESCPIIFPLTITNVEEELNEAMAAYLKREVSIIKKTKTIQLNQLFLFYIADFGGKKGLKKQLYKLGLIEKKELNFTFKFTPFDKSLKLHNFK